MVCISNASDELPKAPKPIDPAVSHSHRDKGNSVWMGRIPDDHSYHRASSEARSFASQFHSYQSDPFGADEEVAPFKAEDRSAVKNPTQELTANRPRPKLRLTGPNRLVASALNDIQKQFKGLNVS